MMNSAGKQTIIITGSSGFIGKAIAERLSSRFHVVGFDQKAERNTNTDSYAVDISSYESISRALDFVRQKYGDRIASVIHLAAYYSFAEQESPKYQQITVKGTEQLILLLRSFQVEQFIFSSTMLVHKPARKGQKIAESSPIEPSWAYPESKVAAEKVLRDLHGEIPLVTLRIAGVYDDRCHSIPIANHIMRIYEKHLSSHLFPGDPSKGQAFLHLEDLIDAIEKVIDKREALPPQVDLLIGEPNVLSYDDLQNEIGTLVHGREWDSLKVPTWFAKAGAWLQNHIPFVRKPFIQPWMIDLADDPYDLNISRACQLLGWQPRHNLRQTLPLMIKALMADPLRWYKENKLQTPTMLARMLGKMPGDIEIHSPSKTYVHQLNALNSLNIFWGLWLIFDSSSRATGSAMMWSEALSGLLLMVFGGLAIWGLWQWPRWLAAIVGLWILLAPLIFWTDSAAAYSTGNLIGLLAVLCGAIQPSRQHFPTPALERPPGWDYNPSAWPQRLPIIALAAFGFFLARYMAAFQLGHIDSVWDPIFGSQTEIILTSDISKAFPISDAGLGAFSYLVDAISGAIGDRRRWRTMPWMVILFGIMIIPPGVTSIALVILQPVGVGAWCFLCLATAVIMLLMVAPALDEVIATIQFLRKSFREGHGFWRTFLRGKPLTTQEIQNAAAAELTKPKQKFRPSLPASLIGSVVLGLLMMALPALLSIAKPAFDLIYLCSALILTFSIIACSEVARPARLINILIGLVLAIAIWLSEGASIEARWSVTLISIAIAVLSLPKGKFRKHFGSYDKVARWSLIEMGGH